MHREETCTLILLYPKHSHATYFDSGSASKKNYTNIKLALDNALNCYYLKGNSLIREKREGTRRVFSHQLEFPCMKQPANSMTEAFYAIHHMQEFVRDQLRLTLPCKLSLLEWDFTRYASDADVRREFYRIQQKLAQLICKDVLRSEGLFYYGPSVPSNQDVEERLRQQGDNREFMTYQGFLPFPPKH